MLQVDALRIYIGSLGDVIAHKLLALTEQEPDYGGVLELARALREPDRLDERAYADRLVPVREGFFTLVEELGVVEPAAASS